jgi:hypothetical protein
MTDDVGVLRNDPNSGLRHRLEPERSGTPSAQQSLDGVLIDLQELVRDRLAAPEVGRRGRRSRRHHRATRTSLPSQTDRITLLHERRALLPQRLAIR